MAAVRFSDVQARPTEFLDLTSLTLDEFEQLIEPFEGVLPISLRESRFLMAYSHPY
jgi:hypothetical protein